MLDALNNDETAFSSIKVLCVRFSYLRCFRFAVLSMNCCIWRPVSAPCCESTVMVLLGVAGLRRAVKGFGAPSSNIFRVVTVWVLPGVNLVGAYSSPSSLIIGSLMLSFSFMVWWKAWVWLVSELGSAASISASASEVPRSETSLSARVAWRFKPAITPGFRSSFTVLLLNRVAFARFLMAFIFSV